MIHIPTEQFDSSVANVQSPKTNAKKKVIGPSKVGIVILNNYCFYKVTLLAGTYVLQPLYKSDYLQ